MSTRAWGHIYHFIRMVLSFTIVLSALTHLIYDAPLGYQFIWVTLLSFAWYWLLGRWMDRKRKSNLIDVFFIGLVVYVAIEYYVKLIQLVGQS